MKHFLWILLSLSFAFTACKKVPFTGRKQVKLLPESTMNSMSFSSYQEFINSNTLSTNAQQTAMVKRVGTNLRDAAISYYKQKGMFDEIKSYRWEFNLVDDPSVNAWCMPGGKVVIYTGILPVTKDEDGLAVVMGHEIAHALARHGNERMSQGLAVQLGGAGLQAALSQKPQQTQDLFLSAYGAGAQLGVMLPFSRSHESEADEIGLYIMAMAGYDPEAAVPFWQRMGAASGGNQPPQFMSTHPSHSTRISNLQKLMPAARAYGSKYGK